MTSLLEACVDSVDNAIRAERSGAHRLELCANLHLDGTTPDEGLIKAVLQSVSIPVKVMIRPRGSSFVYTDAELDEMLHAIELCKSLDVPEIATGALLDDHRLDMLRISQLAVTAAPMSVTIHKCIDLVPDILTAIDVLKNFSGVTSILSSGQAATAWDGRIVLREMHAACRDALTLIVAGKVTRENLLAHVAAIGAREYHGRRIV